MLEHRLTCCHPRTGLLVPYPVRWPPRYAWYAPPAPPEPTAHIWPNDRRRKRSRPDARRVRPDRGLAWYQTLPPALVQPPRGSRPGATTRPAVRRQPPTRLAALLPPPPLPSALFVGRGRRRRAPVRWSRTQLGTRLAAFRLCHDPSMAAGLFFRDGPAGATFIHNTTVGDAVQQGAGTFVRSGPAAATWFRSRC